MTTAKVHAYAHPHPAVTVDCVVFGLEAGELGVLLVRRGLAPFEGRWALPGGFVRLEESLDDAARRELQEETGLRRLYLEQLFTFGAVRRDPRERVISVAYFALVRRADHTLCAATDARDAQWFPAAALPSLAFDHAEILAVARERLRAKVRYRPIGFELLPAKFTLSQLQQLYETVLERRLDKRNFRKKVLAMGFLDELDELQRDVAHRAARMYRFNPKRYRALEARGIEFDL